MELQFGEPEKKAAERLIVMALEEDLGGLGDLTSQTLIQKDENATVSLITRKSGVLAGLPIVEMVFAELDSSISCNFLLSDGDELKSGDRIAYFSGSLLVLLTAERTVLNFLTHLSGIASLTRRFVEAVCDIRTTILDTRKTHPGYRILEKYAVRAGGGANHRMGLYDGVLIKDNHLAGWKEFHVGKTIADAIRLAKSNHSDEIPIEVEVDNLQQLEEALSAKPDMILLDNMDCDTMKRAVELRNDSGCEIPLEASGGIGLENVRQVAERGVERISLGCLTHSATALDLAFDWFGKT